MSEYLIDGTKLTNIADAIREKTGETAQMGVDAMPAKIRSISSSAPVVDEDADILFIGYDGTPVESWSLEDLAGKTALPTPPTHEGLTFQEWNWTLAQLQAENAPMVVGACYITDDGKTRFHVSIRTGAPEVTINFAQTVANGVTINWGDGSGEETVDGAANSVIQASHTYTATGNYTITMLPADGCTMSIGGANVQKPGFSPGIFVTSIELGTGCTYINGYAFYGLFNLERVTIPVGVVGIENYTGSNLSALSGLVIPASANQSGSRSIKMETAKVLRNVSFPYNLHGYVDFNNASFLSRVALPTNVTRAYFQYDSRLRKLDGLQNLDMIMTSSFSSCASLERISIGATTVQGSAFSNCLNLIEVVFSGDISTIQGGAFGSCKRVSFYDFTACTVVPTLQNTNVFSGIPSDCQIRVPASLVDEWKAATNWATYADYIVGVSSDDQN